MVGTRPECIKMAPVIKALKTEASIKVRVVSTGQHRDMVAQILSLFDIEIDHDLDVMQENQTLCSLSARIFQAIEAVIDQEKPDLMLVQGDTTSVMVAALAGFYKRLPVGHVEAGLRTNRIDMPFPEEMNRVVAGVVSSLHFAPTQGAYDNLAAEGKDKESLHLTGNTVIDALYEISEREYPCAYPTVAGRDFVLVTAHRRENFGEPLRAIASAIADLHDKRPDLEFVYPVHPNPNVKEPVYEILGDLDRVHLCPPADYHELITLMKHARLVLTDSGGIQEEAPALGKPVLVLRNETERPEAVDAGVARLVGPDRAKIVEWVEKLLDDEAAYNAMAVGASPYGDGKAAGRITQICLEFLGTQAQGAG